MELTQEFCKSDTSMERHDTNEAFSTLIDLFRAIDIREKGIEVIYNYLLQHQTIEDPKTMVEELNISLKRIYKVIQLLENHGLVQIYSRPMKIIINHPLTAWQTLISEKIKELQTETNQKIEDCESAFRQFIDAYRIKAEEPTIPPVEYLVASGTEDPMEFVSEVIGGTKILEFALGFRFNNGVNRLIQAVKTKQTIVKGQGFKTLEEFFYHHLSQFPPINYRILIPENSLEDVHQRIKELGLLELDQTKICGQLHLNIDIRVSPHEFGNFIIKDTEELLQFSIAPDNSFLGLFVSRYKESYEIFRNKFHELFSQAKPIDEYYKKINRSSPTLFEKYLLIVL